MDYGLIKKLAQEKGITIKKLAEMAGITEQGFHKTIKNETLQIVVLERIAAILEVSPAVFWGATNNIISFEVTELLRENRELRIKIETLQKDYKSKITSHSGIDEHTQQPQLKNKPQS